MALIQASSATILSWSMPLDDLVLWDSLANASTTARAGTDVTGCINIGLCWGSWLYLFVLSLGWAVVKVWTKIAGQLEGPSLEAFLSVCSS
jgi:hypothetical protein